MTREGKQHPETADPSAEMRDPWAAHAAIRANVEAKIERLPRQMRQVLVGLYAVGMSLEEVGRALGLNAGRACHVHTEALRLLAAPVSDRGQECAPRTKVENNPACCRARKAAGPEHYRRDLSALAALVA